MHKLAVCAGLVLSFLIVPHSALTAENWELIIAPYALFPSIEGTASVGPVEGADIDVGPDDILNNLDIGGMIQLEAIHRSGFGATLSYNFMDLLSETSGPGGNSIEADIFQGILEAYGVCRISTERGPLDVYGGLRWWDMGIEAGGAGNPTTSVDEDWVDPVIGIRWLPSLSEKWALILKGDIGGFGIGADFTWNVQGGITWDATRWLTVVLQYRALHVDYSSGAIGSETRFAYDTVTHGPVIGAAFRF